jgi:hypothetical protein
MNPFKRLWQWYKDRRIERHMFKGRRGSDPTRSQGTTPIVGIAEDARLRLLKEDRAPRA